MPDGLTDDPKRQRLLLTLGLLVADGTALAVALVAAHRFAFAWSTSYAPAAFPPALWLVLPIAITLFAIGRLYVPEELFEGSIEYGRVVYGCTLASLSLIIMGFWGKFLGEVAPSRTLIVLVWGLSIALAGGGRFALRRVVRLLRRRGHLVSRAVIVGLGSSGVALAQHFQQARHAGIKVVGFVDDFLPSGTVVVDNLKVLGPPSALDDILEQTRAHEVIIVPTATAWESFQELIRRVSSLNGYRVRLAPGSRDLLATTLRAHQLASIPMLTVEHVRIVGLDRVLKSALDYGIVLLFTPLVVPLVLLAAVALRVSGIRPLRRVRIVGRGGRPFTTFVLNVGDGGARLQALIIQLGVDRLPQLVSVLLGRMSLVGPRPIPVERRSSYATWLPSLLTVKPGLTGAWSVRRAASLEEEMELSLFYIRNYTIWLDAEVLFRAAIQLLSRSGRRESKEGASLRERVPVHH